MKFSEDQFEAIQGNLICLVSHALTFTSNNISKSKLMLCMYVVTVEPLNQIVKSL